MKKVIILRGLPGSGKSTATAAINELLSNVSIHSTDAYFGEEYNWTADKNYYYHKLNKQAFLDALMTHDTIVCDNTNTAQKDVKSYLNDVSDDYRKIIIAFEPSSLQTHFDRTIHNVPMVSLEGMNRRYDCNFTLDNVLLLVIPNTYDKSQSQNLIFDFLMGL